MTWETFIVTAYCACLLCTGHTHGITKSGTRAIAGVTIACAPALMGKTVEIAGVGLRVCQDTGSKIGRHRLDLYVKTHDEALQFGKHRMRARVR